MKSEYGGGLPEHWPDPISLLPKLFTFLLFFQCLTIPSHNNASYYFLIRFDKKMRDILIEFERIVIPDDESVPEKDTQNETESADNKLTSQQPTTITSAPTKSPDKQDEIDDFDFLGDEVNVMSYLNSENKDSGISGLSCVPLPPEETVDSRNEEGEGSVRRNLARKAKEGISYTLCDDDDTDDYCKCPREVGNVSNPFSIHFMTPSPSFRLLEVQGFRPISL